MLIIHIVYRIVRAFILTLQSIFRSIFFKNRILHTSNLVEIGTIIYKRKTCDADVAHPSDFIWITSHYSKIEELLHPNWSLYTVDSHYAYFILMPKPAETYTIDVAPFVYVKQFQDGLKLAKCTLENFYSLTSDLRCDRGPVVFETNGARSCSSLMGTLLQATGAAMVLGEPDSLTALPNLIDRNTISDGQCEKMLQAIVKFLCKAQTPNQVYVIKTRSHGVRLVPYLKRVCPNAKHFFMFAKKIEKILYSSEKMLKHAIVGRETIFLWNYLTPQFACWLIHFAETDYRFKIRFGMNDCLDYSILLNLNSYYSYIKHKELFDLPCVFKEDLQRDPRSTIIPVLQLCGIPTSFVDKALLVFDKDSQGGTKLSQDEMKNVASSQLTSDKIQKIKHVCKVMEMECLI